MNPLEMMLRLLLTIFLSGVIGYEREMKSRPAGLRTHIMVGVGSALFMIISLEMAETYPNSEVTRIPAQVVSGIGFLGAGTIFANRGNVTGLTTASSLWLVAGIGLAIGLGQFILGIFTTAIGLLILVSVTRLYGPIQHRHTHYLIVTMNWEDNSVSELMAILQSQDLLIEEVQIGKPKSLADQAEDMEVLVKVKGKFNEQKLGEALINYNFTLKMCLEEN